MAQLRKEADAGDMRAAALLANMLEEDGDLEGAKRWNRYGAEGGDAAAALSLGILLSEEGSLKEAEKWLRQSAAATDPDGERFSEIAAGMLGRVLLDSDRVDEAEPWIKRAVEAGVEPARKDLERLQRIRSGSSQRNGSRGSGDETLQTFQVHGIILYDGTGHRLGPSDCTLTRTRFIIEDARGGISQIQLHDINSVNTPAPIISPKQLRIKLSGITYDIYCHSKDQKSLLETWLLQAIRGT